ncbi:MAG: glycosyltransferase family 4 protein [Vicinamibacterales bacterium]
MAFVSGAAGQAVTELAIGQRRAGHTVALVASKTPVASTMNQPHLVKRLTDAGIGVHMVDTLAARQTGPNADVVQFIHDHLGTAAAFDVLHTHGTVPSVIAIAAARKVTARVPILQTTHEWTVSRPTPGRQAYDLEVMNLVDRAVVPTWAVAEHFVSRGVVRRQLAVVPYGIPPSPPPSMGDGLEREMRAWREAGGLVLCYSAATATSHDQRVLSNALPHIDARHRILCAVFGLTEAQMAAATFPSDGPVTVRIAPLHAPLRRYAHEADFLVLPSGDGEQPLAVLEAFCDGVPVVAGRVPELTEFIEDGQTGWIFDPSDAKALAATIGLARSAAPHSLQALRQRARVRYQSEFTVDRMVSGYMREYARLA